jgi:glycosyltransferase involved in cell wall biosynthesis
MYNGQTLSVVISTYREKNSIRHFIEECFQTGFVDEVIVVNNNAEDGTDDEVKKTKAKLISETRQGYGFGYQKGLREATGDYIIMTEADGTFLAKDFEKLLVYSRDFEVVFCTRTATYAIHDGANMGLFLQWGNWAVAKMIEVMFLTTQLSDVGCTMRLIKKDVLDYLLPSFNVGNSHFGLEMILNIVMHRIPFVEIPVSYLPRVGESSVTGSFWKALVLGFTMIGFIFKKRIFSSRNLL